MIQIAAAQMAVSERIEENYEHSVRLIREAARRGVRLICFPEGQLAPYMPQYRGRSKEQFAVTMEDDFLRGLCRACREEGILACLGLSLEAEGKVYPSALLISEQGQVLGVGKKNHIACFANYYEQDYYTQGEGGFVVADTSIGKVGMIVCFDRHYPESYRSCVLQGAQLILIPVANDKTENLEMFEWEIRVAAFQNSVNIAMVNRVGAEGRMDFCGRSLFVNADGSVASRAGEEEEMLFARLDLPAAERLRREKQYLPLRRPEVFTL